MVDVASLPPIRLLLALMPRDRSGPNPKRASIAPINDSTTLLSAIVAFCREHALAESTFGRLAVNDSKFVARLRDGGRVRMQTLSRVRLFLASPLPNVDRPLVIGPQLTPALPRDCSI